MGLFTGSFRKSNLATFTTLREFVFNMQKFLRPKYYRMEGGNE